MIPVTIFLGMLGATEIILIIAVLILIFGGKKIPELMRGIGKGISEFKKARNDDDHLDDPSIK